MPERQVDRARSAGAHTDGLLAAIANGVEVLDLGRPLFVGMPQSPNHPAFRLVLERRHGDRVRPDGSSAANEMIVLGGHVGTHIDALCHVSFEGRLHGGADATQAAVGGRFTVHGAETIAPVVRRGVMLDVAGALGLEMCPPDREITPEDLEHTMNAQGPAITPGDVVLVHTGWGRLFERGAAYIGEQSGVPGVGEAGARWLAERGAPIVGADTIAFEHIPPKAGHQLLPAHRYLLVERGVHIIEALYLEVLAQRRIYEFVFICSPLRLVGATGSPVRPLALVATSGAR